MHGFLNIDKPAGMTSHDVVARVRRLARQKRVGHAGTLDPAATGVLVVALGAATRLIEYVQEATSKRYTATVELGTTTATDDAEGEVLTTSPVPALDRAAIELALDQFRGPIMQVPPMYSALHHQGQRLHELARAGVVLDLPARPVTIERLELLAWDTPRLVLDMTCSKGTYVRALARDLGAALGCGAHLAALRRTAVGTFVIDDAVPLDVLVGQSEDKETGRQGDKEAKTDLVSQSSDLPVSLSQVLLPPEQAVADWPVIQLDEAAARLVRNGMPLVLEAVAGERARAHAPDGQLLALLARSGAQWRPDKVFDWS
jgi:tRNA pseudouridine55 synthase